MFKLIKTKLFFGIVLICQCQLIASLSLLDFKHQNIQKIERPFHSKHKEHLKNVQVEKDYKNRRKRSLPEAEVSSVNIDEKSNSLLLHWVDDKMMLLLAKQSSTFDSKNTTQSTMYFSYDYGKNYEPKISSDSKHTGKSNVITGLVTQFKAVEGNAKYFMMIDQPHKTLFITLDGGQTFTSVPNLEFSLDKIEIHPTVHNLVVALDQTSSNKGLYLSTDNGLNWNRIQTGVKDAYWGYNPDDKLQTEDEAKSLYVVREEPGGDVSVVKSIDFVTFKPIISNVLEFVLANKTMFALTSAQGGASKDLWIAPTRDSAFVKVNFNGDQLADSFRDYLIVDSSESQVLLLAMTTSDNKAHLFMSEPNLVDFTLSLANIKRVYSYQNDNPRLYEVYKLHGMRSVFIANVESTRDWYHSKKTLITFDKGAVWKPIPTPPKDSHGNEYRCATTHQNCSLLLYQHDDQKAPHFDAFSSMSAPGYLLVEGAVVASDISQRPRGVFFSTDGGKVFKELMKGSYHKVWVDHGGVIAMVPQNEATKSMMVSVNGGESWTEIAISEKPMMVYGVLTEPGETSTIFTVFGSDSDTYWFDFKWHVVQVDVKKMLGSKCSSNQYEQWSLTDENGDSCVMGTRNVYQRRKLNMVCLNDRPYDRPKMTQVCQCRRKDYECDAGFIATHQRDFNSYHQCVPDNTTLVEKVPPTCHTGGVYRKTTGYRKLAGDKCFGGEESTLSPQLVPCPFEEEKYFLASVSFDTPEVIHIHNILTNETSVWLSSGLILEFDFDFATNCIFHLRTRTPSIFKHCFDQPSDTNKVVVNSDDGEKPSDIAVDWLGRNLYWVEYSGRVSVSDMNGNSVRSFVPPANVSYKPTSLTLDPVHATLYTTHYDRQRSICAIRRQSMDFSGDVITMFTSPCTDYTTIRYVLVDPEAPRTGSPKIFWIFNDTVWSMKSDATASPVKIVTSPDVQHYLLAMFKDKLLMAYTGARQTLKFPSPILPAPQDFNYLKDILAIKVFSKQWQTHDTKNPCGFHTCQHLCLLSNTNPSNKTCVCGNGDDMVIKVDENGNEVCSCPKRQIKNDKGFCTAGDHTTCTGEFFQCKSGQCIHASKKCDKNFDCMDRSDEKNCTFCTEVEFMCKQTRECISKSWVCDRENDCPDGSDEQGCLERPCDNNQFKCKTSGQCIPASYRCDGEDDCMDFSDESGCIDISPSVSMGSCNIYEFTCPQNTTTNSTSTPKSTCIGYTQICDGVIDCPGGTDEAEERCHRQNCSTIQYKCDNGNCIYDWELCDGHNDCGDNSDERNCAAPVPTIATHNQTVPSACPHGHLTCRSSGHCYPLEWACDGVDDCGDSSDEFDCKQAQNQTDGMLVPCLNNISQFKCATGDKCVFSHLKCDGDNDCLDWSDERDCPGFHKADDSECVTGPGSFTYTGKRSYTKNGFTCQRWDSDTPHVPNYKPIDQHHNYCRNPDHDSTGPWCYTTNPNKRWDYCAIPLCANTTVGPGPGRIPTREPGSVHCPDGYMSCGGDEASNCILSRFACDGDRDCANGNDEKYCHKQECAEDEMHCLNGNCVKWSLRCNGVDDCKDGSDELSCYESICRIGQYQCPVEPLKCIDEKQVCDGVKDCKFGEDERNCPTSHHTGPYIPNEFTCVSNGKKISLMKICDFVADCEDLSDEQNCRVSN